MPMRWLLAIAALGSNAHADDVKNACASASETAQQLRIDGKLRAAHEQLTACSRPICPAIVKRDCDAWLSEVEAILPSIVLVARDETGRDLVDVRVLLDAEP